MDNNSHDLNILEQNIERAICSLEHIRTLLILPDQTHISRLLDAIIALLRS